MQIDPLVIKYKSENGQERSDSVYARRLKFRRRAKLYSDIERQLPAGKKSEDGNFDFKDVPKDVMADFVVAIISESLVTAEGHNCVTADDVDEWEDAKRNAYFSALLAHQNPKTEVVAKNSSSTASVATS